MSVFLSSLLLFLCLSMHACRGRHLSAIDDKDSSGGINLEASKDAVEKAEKLVLISKNLIPLKKKHLLSKELPKLEEAERINTGSIIKESDDDQSGARAYQKLQESNKGLPEEAKEMKRRISGSFSSIDESLVSVSWRVPRKKQGSEIILSSDVGLQQYSTKIQGSLERRGRSVLGTASHVTEETIDSKENGVMEDVVVVMDYEPPHRKPPIHNLSP